MPNRRSKDKVFLGGFVEKSLKRRLISLARDAGMDHDRFGFVVGLVSDKVARRWRSLRGVPRSKRRTANGSSASRRKTVKVRS